MLIVSINAYYVKMLECDYNDDDLKFCYNNVELWACTGSGIEIHVL